MSDITISEPSDLYEHVRFLMPNASFEKKHDEGNNSTIIMRIKKYDTYIEKDSQVGEYEVEAEHVPKASVDRIRNQYLTDGWDTEITGEQIGADAELEFCLIPPEDYIRNN